jgi:hypothetical protein
MAAATAASAIEGFMPFSYHVGEPPAWWSARLGVECSSAEQLAST